MRCRSSGSGFLYHRQARLDAPKSCRRKKKGHGTTFRRHAMTSILKRDILLSRPPGFCS